jgi:hypothetical protein
MVGPWWERYPERYQSELGDLAAAGIRYEIDKEALAKGFLKLHVYPIERGDELHLVATFPDLYPFFKFEVDAPTLALPYHQHAASKTLCLLPRGTGWWRPGTDRLAQFLVERLPLVLSSASATEASAFASGEEHQAEPFSDYYGYAPESYVLVDSSWHIPTSASEGTLEIGAESWPPNLESATPVLRFAVLEVLDRDNQVIAKASPVVSARYPRRLSTSWRRISSPPAPASPDVLFNTIAMDDKAPRVPPVVVDRAFLWIRAAIFPEEHQWRGISAPPATGWLFAARVDRHSKSKHGRRARRQVQQTFLLARPFRYGEADLAARLPQFNRMRDKRIAVFGLGCLGAASAIEFARAGVGHLDLVDYDFVDPATTVRWPMGLGAAGQAKTAVLRSFLAREYPYTRVTIHDMRVGGVGEEHVGERGRLELIVGDASLVYDATGEYGIQYFLSDLCAQHDIDYTAVDSTVGAWGGKVVRILPNARRGCWECAQGLIEKGIIEGPPADGASGRVQPVGCADPTFTGAQFDTGEVALMGVRSGVSALAEDSKISWDVAVLSLRTSDGQRRAPQWATATIAPEQRCANCQSRFA